MSGGITIPEESDHHEEQSDHRNMKTVESSGGSGSQSWLSNKDSKLQYDSEDKHSGVSCSYHYENSEKITSFLGAKDKYRGTGILESFFSLLLLSLFFKFYFSEEESGLQGKDNSILLT